MTKRFRTVVFCDISGSKRNHLQDDLHSWYRVKSVKETGEEKIVYNITVEEDNSYVADGIVVHNCQDMSIAGKRSGLDGERSSLFYEAVRIVKEMREKTNGQYPRYIVWENVPGAFSSNGGEDFRCVLEEICKVEDERISVPKPDRWTNAGEIVGNEFSLAWRVLDAEGWGVPQRRKRIFLVADFGGRSAGKILFESEGLSRYTPQGFRSWQRTAGNPTQSIGATGFDGYNGILTGDISSTLGENCGISTGRNGIVLNDQGGQRIDVTDDVTSTLRAEAHHPPCVMSAGFCTEYSANARGIGYEEERSPTLRAGVVPAVVPLENHPTDGRVKIEEGGMVQTLSNRMGTGGNNVPLLMEEQVPITLKIRSGCAGGGKGQLCQVDKSATLGCNNDQTLFVPEQESCYWDGGQTAGTLTEKNARGTQRMPDKDNFNCVLESNIPKAYGISSFQSNAMLSDNPHSGIYEAETSRTLDTGGGNPDCNQGGVAIVEKAYSIQGNLIGRDDKNGPQGNGINEDVSFTLNATDHHAVCSNGKEEPKYTVRRLTPAECARLQGFPDWWCKDLGNPNPTDEEVAFWTEVWEAYRKAVTLSSKPKTEKQVRKWLANPYSDSAEYRLWGNGVALPCVYFIMCGIAWATEKKEK
ncbi:MAG: DNA cytosine methyltransferase [Oscillospiraceae bacterium]|nr:DNA cytosine methyltransferase [Oscillospiraceae bacterium]